MAGKAGFLRKRCWSQKHYPHHEVAMAHVEVSSSIPEGSIDVCGILSLPMQDSLGTDFQFLLWYCYPLQLLRWTSLEHRALGGRCIHIMTVFRRELEVGMQPPALTIPVIIQKCQGGGNSCCHPSEQCSFWFRDAQLWPFSLMEPVA